MAPDWARATRPLVLVFTGVTFIVTLLFRADVDAQGGAYATGVLVLMTSAAFAVAMAAPPGWWRRAYGVMTLVFGYTTAANIVERPDGVKIATAFIVTIVTTSVLSRVTRSTELRVKSVRFDEMAERFLHEFGTSPVRIIAHRPDKGLPEEYDRKERVSREEHSLDRSEPILFLEVMQSDASDFEDDVYVRGVEVGRHRVMRCTSPAIPNAIAALLLSIRDRTGRVPHAYFGWTEGSPFTYVFKYLAFGEGETAPVVREVLRQAVKDPASRPRIHVG
jgi:hypothetical protein